VKTCVLLITVSEKSCVLGGQQILVEVQTFHPNRKICFFLIPKKRNLHLTVEVAGSLFGKAESSEASMVCYLQMVG
jgi:hypothetical protein